MFPTIRRLATRRPVIVTRKNTTDDLVGPPNPISNLRCVTYHVLPNESSKDKEWRLHRERVDRFNRDFWSSNNELFLKAKQEFENETKSRTDAKPTTEEYSAFYRRFLDEAYPRQMAYNRQWWIENVGMLWPALNASLRHWMRSRNFKDVGFWDKNTV